MINTIEISEQDEQVFEFETFELVLYKNDCYILSEEGYFPIEGLQSFKKIDNQYIIINEDQDKFILSEENFEKIKDIYLKFY